MRIVRFCQVCRCVLRGIAWVLAIAVMVQPAMAGVVVDWGGRYVSQSQLFADSGSTNLGSADVYGDKDGPVEYPPDSLGISGQITGRLPSEDVEYNPERGLNYSGKSDKFYGGHAVVFSASPSPGDGDGLSNLIVEQQGDDDKIHVETHPTSSLQRFAMLTYWDENDFLGGGSQFLVNGTSEFTLTSTQDAQQKDAEGHSLRWVIRNGAQFYLSTALSFANSGTYTSNIYSLSNWTEYNPFNTDAPALKNLLLSESDAGLPFAGGSLFDNVTAVGYYVEYLRPTDKNGAGKIDYKIAGFKAILDPNGNSVPEPGAFLLGLAGFGGVALKRWRQRRKAGGTDAAQLTEAAN